LPAQRSRQQAPAAGRGRGFPARPSATTQLVGASTWDLELELGLVRVRRCLLLVAACCLLLAACSSLPCNTQHATTNNRIANRQPLCALLRLRLLLLRPLTPASPALCPVFWQSHWQIPHPTTPRTRTQAHTPELGSWTEDRNTQTQDRGPKHGTRAVGGWGLRSWLQWLQWLHWPGFEGAAVGSWCWCWCCGVWCLVRGSYGRCAP
jgi:hypothetical protein